MLLDIVREKCAGSLYNVDWGKFHNCGNIYWSFHRVSKPILSPPMFSNLASGPKLYNEHWKRCKVHIEKTPMVEIKVSPK